jgi:hypothetical protein
MRIDEKEERIKEICDRYGLIFDYAWGKYYISVPVDYDFLSTDPSTVIWFSREDLGVWGVDRVEELIIAYVIEFGVW